MGKNVVWNALKIVKINHRSYFNIVKIYAVERQFFQAWFELELQCLNECSEVIDFSEDCKFDINSFENPHVGLQTPR